MEFTRSRELKLMETMWEKIVHHTARRDEINSIKIYGPFGSGKTHFVQELVRNHRGFYYMSFAGLTREEALQKFVRLYLPENAIISNWEEAAKAFTALRDHRRTLLIFEDEPQELQQECKQAFAPYTRRKGLFRIGEISQEKTPRYEFQIPISNFSIADFMENLPSLSRPDVVRLYALTGGFPAVVKDLNAQRSFEENVRQLLAYDSVFSTYLPERMREYFRSPESYYPLLRSMAFGRNRLSEMAKDAGFANNKCGKYLEALIEAGFVRAEHDSGPYAKYYLTHSYYTAWARYAYLCTNEQIARPEKHLQFVLSDLDEAIAVPAFQKACLRFLNGGEVDNAGKKQQKKNPEIHRSIPIEFSDGNAAVLDYHKKKGYYPEIYVFPQTLTTRFTKTELKKVLAVVNEISSPPNLYLAVFSLERFSDWCVHESAKLEYLHEVTMDRLRF